MVRKNRRTSSWLALTAGLSFLLMASTLPADITPNYGFDWVTIGDINNPGSDHQNGRGYQGRGSVSYRYRMSRTEFTVNQHLEFLRAFEPYIDDDEDMTVWDHTGIFIDYEQVGGHYQFEARSGWENAASQLAPRTAARYANWLHNGNVNERWAFETGVYDATTFGRDDEGRFTDDFTRLPGAKFWIPSLDEYFKAVYYDPNKDGLGEGGWWLYPNGTDEPLELGFPEEGGETNASLFRSFSFGPFLPVGQYPDSGSPWGLLDVSGGMMEMTETHYFGSDIFTDNEILVAIYDEIGVDLGLPGRHPNRPYSGFRLASDVPSPPTVVAFLFGSVFFVSKRQRRKRWSIQGIDST